MRRRVRQWATDVAETLRAAGYPDEVIRQWLEFPDGASPALELDTRVRALEALRDHLTGATP